MAGGGFGSKIFRAYPEEVVALWAAKRVGRPVKWVCDRSEAFLADAHGRDHVTHAEMAFDGDGKITGLRAKTTANLGAYMSTFPSLVPTLSLRHAAVGPARHSAIYIARSTRSTPTPCRSTPIAAPAVRKRPSWSSGWSRSAPAQMWEKIRTELRRKNFVKTFPHQTPVIGDVRRWRL